METDVKSFIEWLDYLKLPKCYHCDEITSEECICEKCNELYCESCSATMTYHNMIDYNCCASCQYDIKWRDDEY